MIHASSSPTRWFDALEKLRCVCTITSTVQVQYNNTSSRSCHSLPIWLIITCNLYHTLLSIGLSWVLCHFPQHSTLFSFHSTSIVPEASASVLRIRLLRSWPHESMLCIERFKAEFMPPCLRYKIRYHFPHTKGPWSIQSIWICPLPTLLKTSLSWIAKKSVSLVLTWSSKLSVVYLLPVSKGELLDSNTRAWAGDKGTLLLYIVHSITTYSLYRSLLCQYFTRLFLKEKHRIHQATSNCYHVHLHNRFPAGNSVAFTTKISLRGNICELWRSLQVKNPGRNRRWGWDNQRAPSAVWTCRLYGLSRLASRTWP